MQTLEDTEIIAECAYVREFVRIHATPELFVSAKKSARSHTVAGSLSKMLEVGFFMNSGKVLKLSCKAGDTVGSIRAKFFALPGHGLPKAPEAYVFRVVGVDEFLSNVDSQLYAFLWNLL